MKSETKSISELKEDFMRKKKWMNLAAIALAGAMFATGCGSSAGSAAQATTQAAQTESSAEETAAQENAEAEETAKEEAVGALVIKAQGIFTAGGTTVNSDGTFDPENQWEETGVGQTAHVDHANVLYQIPEDETELPMVFLHGYGQSRMGWMTTPDGREGWSDMFLRKGHSVFLIDEPRRGEAGSTSVSGDISTKTLDQRWYTQFRIGRWEMENPLPTKVLSSQMMTNP